MCAANLDVSVLSRQLPQVAPLLPIAMSPATSDDDIELTTGPAGHRKRVEAWPVQFLGPANIVENKTVTTVEADRARGEGDGEEEVTGLAEQQGHYTNDVLLSQI